MTPAPDLTATVYHLYWIVEREPLPIPAPGTVNLSAVPLHNLNAMHAYALDIPITENPRGHSGKIGSGTVCWAASELACEVWGTNRANPQGRHFYHVVMPGPHGRPPGENEALSVFECADLPFMPYAGPRSTSPAQLPAPSPTRT